MRQVPKLKLFTVIMSSEFGNNMLLPLLTFIFFSTNSPLFANSPTMAKRSMLFGLCLSLYKISGVIGCTILSGFSDIFGRKFALYCTLSGLLIVASCGVTALYLHNPFLLISGYVLVGFLDVNLANGPAIIGDISTAQNRTANMATIQCVIAVGACLGPILGGQLANQHYIQTAYALPFFIAAVIAIINLLIIHYCPETLIKPAQRTTISFIKIAKDYWGLLQVENVMRMFSLLMLSQLSWSSYYQFIPPTLKNIFHYSPAKVGIFVGLIAFWLILAAGIIIRILLKFFNNRQLMCYAVTAVLAGTLLSWYASEHPAFSGSEFLLWLSPLPTAMGDVIFFSLFTSLLSQSLSPYQQGKAMGLTRTIATLIWSLSALAGGMLTAWHANGALLFAPAGALVLLVLLNFSSQKLAFINRNREDYCDTVS
jgi:MFS transporter, DHA1 family, tetracycline resistance protein